MKTLSIRLTTEAYDSIKKVQNTYKLEGIKVSVNSLLNYAIISKWGDEATLANGWKIAQSTEAEK
jgi:hypothetical protein